MKEIDHDFIDHMIDEIDELLTFSDIAPEQRTELTRASNALAVFRSITNKYYSD